MAGFFNYGLPYQTEIEPVLATPETVTEDRWHQPLSEPVRLRRLATALTVAACVLAPLPQVPSPAHYDPEYQAIIKKPKLHPAYQDIVADVPYNPAAPSTAVLDWFQPLSQLPRDKVVASNVTFGFSNVLFDNEVTFHQPWSDPVRRKVTTGYLQDPSPDFFVVTPAETITVDKWFAQFRDPVRSKRFATALNPARSFTAASPFNETITEDKWHQPWSEPVRLKQGKPGFHASRQQFFTIDPRALTQVEPTTEDRWHQPWSLPQSLKKRGLDASRQPFTTISPTALTLAEAVTESRWHQPWSEPKRYRPRFHPALNPYEVRDPTLVPTLPPITGVMAAIETGDTAIMQGTVDSVISLAKVSIEEFSATGTGGYVVNVSISASVSIIEIPGA